MYEIAIISKKRKAQLRHRTLSFLKKSFSDIHVHIFVDPEDYTDYEEFLILEEPFTGIKNLHLHIGGRGMVDQRLMVQTVLKSKNILCIDDDVSDVTSLLEEVDSEFVDRAFKKCLAEGCHLWGIHPVSNPFFQQKTVTTDLRYIVGCFYGLINDRPMLVPPCEEKEDIWRTLQWYGIDGKVLRFNYASPVTRYWKEPGGIQSNVTEEERILRTKEACAHLYETFGGAILKVFRRKNGMWDVRLKRRCDGDLVSDAVTLRFL